MPSRALSSCNRINLFLYSVGGVDTRAEVMMRIRARTSGGRG